jgi:DMSO/TMAO reductase YedYZ molybdopterin-dependent catalytic subunit
VVTRSDRDDWDHTVARTRTRMAAAQIPRLTSAETAAVADYLPTMPAAIPWPSIQMARSGRPAGRRLSDLLSRVGLVPDARFAVFHCADELSRYVNQTYANYESADPIGATIRKRFSLTN